MEAYADLPLRDLLDEVAAQRPAPGGGCAAAWACAMSAGLVEMAAAFTLARPRYAGVHQRMLVVRKEAAATRRQVLELAEEDAGGYAPVLEAMRLPEKHPQRAARLEAARSQASEAPLATAEAAAGIAELGAETARSGNVTLRGDAVTAAVLAEAACRAAAQLVEINLSDRPDDPRLARLSDAVRRAERAREAALSIGGEAAP